MLAEVTYNIANSLLFVVPFAYLDKKHVHVFIDNKEINNYIWQTNTSILLEGLSGKKLLIKRNTPLSDYSFRFIEATALTAEVLNIIYLQHLYVLEELNDLIAKTISNPELIGNLKLQIDKLKAQEKAVNDNIKKIKELIQNTNKNIADKIRDNNKIVSKVNDLLKKVSDTLKEIKKIHGDITSKNIYPLKIFNADSTKHIVIAPDEAISKNYNLTLPEDAPKDTEFLQYDASKSSFVWAKPTEEKKEFIELNSKSGHQVRIYPAANLQKDMKINLGDDVFKLCSSIDKTTENKLTVEINTNKKDISDLETSIINEVKELTGVDDGLRNDVDINTAAIVNLKQNKAKIATQDEANNGADDSKIVTPKKLKTITDNLIKDRTTLEASIRTKLTQLDGVDSDLRKDTDGNTSDIAQLKVKGAVVATETTAGVAEIATQNEANNGNDDSKIVTPKKLKTITDNLIKDRTTLEASIRTKLTQLDGVDSNLRKDTDGNTSDIAQLKATETADIKGVIDKITKLTATDTGGVATLTKAISDLAKKEKSDIAGIKTQQQTNTTAINDLKNKTVTLIDASESTKGVAEIATQDEANNGNDDSKIVTPKKLKVITSDLDRRATRIRNDVDRNTADLVTHRTDIQQNTTDIVSNTASIATIITTIKKGITTDKLAKSFTVPSVLHDKIEVNGEDKAGHYGYAVAMHNDYLAISDPVLQEVVIYQRDKNNKKIFNIEDVHKGKKHGGIFVEGDQVYAKRKDGKYLDVFEYDETQTNLTFKKVNTINLTASYGNSLAINDNYLIVGNPQASTALIYKHRGLQPQLVEKLSGRTSFGSDVAISHKYILVSEVANKKVEAYTISRGFDFSAERVTGRFKVKSDVYLNAPTASTAGFLGYTVADDDGVNFYQLAQNLDDNAVYVRKFDDGNNGVWETGNQSSFEHVTKTDTKTVTAYKKYQRFYSVNQIHNKLIVGTYNEWDRRSSVRYAGHLAVEVETNKIYYKGFDNTMTEAWEQVPDKMPLDDFHQMMSATNRTITVENNTANMVVGRFYYNTEDHDDSGDNTYFKSTRQIYAFAQDDVSFAYTGTTGNWVRLRGGRPADPIQLEVVSPTAIKHVKTLTGGTSFGKLIDLTDDLSAFAEPDNNILKIYIDNVETASKTVKADCVSVGKNIVLATSKVDKKAYIYSLLMLHGTGWFTTTETKWQGIPDNANGYTGYHIKGGQYQLVRPVGTTDTYTKYAGGAWVKNGSWGGVLWYLGGKIGFAAQNEDWKKIGQSISASISQYKAGVQLSADGSIVSIGVRGANYVEIYKYNNGNNTWEILGNRITGSGNFGISVSLSADGGIVSIGTETGKYVEIYKYNNGNNAWEILGNRITGSGNFGWGVSLSVDGGIVSIGSYADNYVEIYKYNSVNNTWEILGNRITGSDSFGISVSLSADGGIVSIGTYTGNYAEIYKLNSVNNTWEILGNRMTGSGRFGVTVSLSADGGIVSIGAYRGNYIKTYKYNSVNNTWEILGNRLTGSSGGFGWNLQLSKDGSTVAASAYASRYERAYRYDKSSNSWKVIGKTKHLTYYNRGSQIALNEDGSVWAIGGTLNSKVEVFSFLDKKIYIDTNDGKHYYGNKEVTDATKFDSIMETVAPLPTLPDTIPQANRNLKLTNNYIQEQPNKTGNYVSLLGTGTAATPTKLEGTNFTIDNNYGDACAITTNKVLITNKTDSKLAIYDHKGTKQKEIQLEAGVGSVIDATDTEAVVGSETANTVDIVSLT